MNMSRLLTSLLITLTAIVAVVNVTGFRSSVASSSGTRQAADSAITVFSGGNLQAALDSAIPGDEIVLEAGAVFIAPGGGFVLRNKVNGANQWITIRTSNLNGIPPEGQRVDPAEHADSMPKILARDNLAALKTEAGANHYRIIGIEFGLAPTVKFNSGGLVRLGDSNSPQSTLDSVPHDIIIDRCYIHGSPTAHAVRGVFLNSARTDVVNSYISDFHGIGQDTQAIAGINGPGPFRIINNYLEAAGENVLFGGGDPKITGLIPSDIEFRRNHVTKPLEWMEGLIPAPFDPQALPINQVGGTLKPGATYYYRFASRGRIGANFLAISQGSPTELAITLGPQQNAVFFSWSPISYGVEDGLSPERYRIYRTSDPPDASTRTWVFYEICEQGINNCSERFQDTNSTRIGFTDVNLEPAGTASPPKTGTRWTVKNLFELKNARRVNIIGNVFEHNWADAQVGFAILLKSANQDGRCDWCVTQNIKFKDNIVRHSASAMNILGRDPGDPSGRVNRIKVKNNLFYDISRQAWGGGHGAFLQITDTEKVNVSYNTILQGGNVLLAYGNQNTAFKFLNNLTLHNAFGVKGDGTPVGSSTLERYFPESDFEMNVLVGGRESNYPADNFFPPTVNDVGFLDQENGNYRLSSHSAYKGRSKDGKDLGANIDKIAAATASVMSTRAARLP